MAYTLKVLPPARKDIREISGYFDDETGNKTKGDKFILAVDKKIKALVKDCYKIQVRYKNVRMSHLKKEKYSIHYIIDEKLERIVVIAVFGMKEDSGKWERRYNQTTSKM